MKQQKGMYPKKTTKLVDREVSREGNLHGKQGAGFRHETKPDSMTSELHGGNPFSKGASQRLKHETAGSICKTTRPLPKNDDSMEGMLNNDQRSDRNVPEKMPRVNIHQGRNDEHIKYDDDLGSGISKKAKRE